MSVKIKTKKKPIQYIPYQVQTQELPAEMQGDGTGHLPKIGEFEPYEGGTPLQEIVSNFDEVAEKQIQEMIQEAFGSQGKSQNGSAEGDGKEKGNTPSGELGFDIPGAGNEDGDDEDSEGAEDGDKNGTNENEGDKNGTEKKPGDEKPGDNGKPGEDGKAKESDEGKQGEPEEESERDPHDFTWELPENMYLKKDFVPRDKIYATIKSNSFRRNRKTQTFEGKGIWTITNVYKKDANGIEIWKVRNAKRDEYWVNRGNVKYENLKEDLDAKRQREEELKRAEEEKMKEQARLAEEERKRKEEDAKKFNFNELETNDKILTLINAGIKNIWMVGPAGCGKSTIARLIAKHLNVPYHCISCGIGTSAVEFTGYKYPEREPTKFGQYYGMPSVILIDEITALDPSVGQVLNSALANGEIETTTGTVRRSEDCIIIATSNTFGAGASRQYVANNQLDASTIDRFVGGIIEVDYSAEYEAQYDIEVVKYINDLRQLIKREDLRRIASTRLIIAGSALKSMYIRDWKDLLIADWTKEEKQLVVEMEEKPIPQIGTYIRERSKRKAA